MISFDEILLYAMFYRGYFNFSLCEVQDKTKPETEECFKGLKLPDGSDKFKVPSKDNGHYKVNLQLPQGLTCDQCVLRWHYNTGNDEKLN